MKIQDLIIYSRPLAIIYLLMCIVDVYTIPLFVYLAVVILEAYKQKKVKDYGSV